MAKKKFVFKVRFKVNGKPKSFKTTASSPRQAAQKVRTKGAHIVSVTKASKA